MNRLGLICCAFFVFLCLTNTLKADAIVGTLNWDAALDPSPGNNFWESTNNAANSRRWNFGGARSPVAATAQNFVNVNQAYNFGPGATMASFQNLGFGAPNPTNQSATFEVVFAPSDLVGNHILLETGANGDGTVIRLQGDQLIFRSQQFNPAGVANDSLFQVSTTLPEAGQFYQVVTTIDLANDQVQLFLNGELVATGNNQLGGNFSDWAGGDASGLGRNNAGVAGNPGGLSNFNGQISIVRFFRNRVLTEAEVRQNFAAITPEPSSIVIFGITSVSGLLAGFWMRRKR